MNKCKDEVEIQVHKLAEREKDNTDTNRNILLNNAASREDCTQKLNTEDGL